MPSGLSIDGDAVLVLRLAPALLQALGDRPRLCAVHLEYVGRGGDILLAVDGPGGRAPVILAPEQQRPELVAIASRDLLTQVSS
jgi:hypothetical protein